MKKKDDDSKRESFRPSTRIRRAEKKKPVKCLAHGHFINEFQVTTRKQM